MTDSLSPVCPSGFSTRTPLADAEAVERMRDPHFRLGWLESELALALCDLSCAVEHVKADFRRRAMVERCASIQRTLRLCREASEASDASEKVLPVAAATVAA